MKFLFVVLSVFAFYTAIAVGLKHPDCGLPTAADGNGVIKCAAFIPSFSYNPSSNQCVDFVYGGCGGNANRFGSLNECENKCKE